jgi:hypothetical protein
VIASDTHWPGAEFRESYNRSANIRRGPWAPEYLLLARRQPLFYLTVDCVRRLERVAKSAPARVGLAAALSTAPVISAFCRIF